MSRPVIAVVGSAVAAVMLCAVPAFASDHLADASNAPGAGQREFENPVGQNPSGTSGAAAQPTTVPGEGNPNAGDDQSTPAVDLSQVNARSGGHAQP
jgi:hypothetical protein